MPDQALLARLLPDTPLLALAETDSTNNDARRWLMAGAPVGSLVLADRQSGGRGRRGHTFASPPGGLYMSVLLPASQPAGVLTTLCGVAVYQAVRALTGLELSIKWVNDLLYQQQKVCGILCEGVWSGNQALGVVAGIGLNVCQTAFPPALAGIARSLYPDGHAPVPLEAFAARIHQALFALLPDAPAHMAQYRARCVTLGKQVVWEREGERCTGQALTVDDQGGLRIQTTQGIITLSAGEVSVRPA